MSVPTLRLLGGGLLVLSGALFGYGGTSALRERARALRALSAALGLLESELILRRTPLPEIFERLRGERFFALFAAGFGAEPTERLWRRAAAALELDDAATRARAGLGAVIGRYDAARQAAEIAAVRARLTEQAAEAERELAARGRRLPGLGAALGAMAAILLF